MNNSTSIRNQHCHNKNCDFYGLSLGNNVVIHSKKNRRFKCSNCGKTWVGHRNEPYFGLRISREKIELALALYKKGGSVRQIAREACISSSTIQRWKYIFEFKI